jgi:hypothetical protein
MGRLVRPDADVVGLLLQLDPVSHAEAPGHLARELNPARAVLTFVTELRFARAQSCGLQVLLAKTCGFAH